MKERNRDNVRITNLEIVSGNIAKIDGNKIFNKIGEIY